ncbi:MAG: alpha/beta fold hydrolase [Actinomycetota bacterium]|nr:alpha/beta fold hydrolase [Actinomycetota bacterium]
MLVLQARSGAVTLSVRVHTDRTDAPTVLLLHGYPDTQRMWDPVVRLLTDEHGLRVVTYDVRGAGGSTAPARTADYASERLVDDLVAVLDRTSPDRAPIHLVGHDWGSVQLWDAVTTEDADPRLRGRIASFTSISGPGLDYVAYALRRARTERDLSLLSSQARRSWYVYAFHLPWLPELVWRHQSARVRTRLNRAERAAHGHWADTLADDGAHGVNLYRANMRQRMRHPRPGRTQVPVQLVVAELDNFVVPSLYRYLEELVPDLTRVDVRAGHWVPRQRPDLVAGLVADHVGRNA